jgi:hypothetical protein
MAKKKQKIINLQPLQLEFEENKTLFKLLSLNTQTMTIEVICYENGYKDKITTLPFAHLPKKLKKIVKPN